MAKNNDKELDFPRKWEKHLPTGWKESSDSLSEEDLKKLIVDSEKTISDVEKDMDADEKLKSLKEDVKDMTGGYKDLIKMNEAKVRYCVFLLKSRGRI